MALENFNDLSRTGTDDNAGFQFEFYCDHCNRTWKSPFKPYRRGQLSALLYMFTHVFDDRGGIARAGSGVAQAGAGRAREKALAEARELASGKYHTCPKCATPVCDSCWLPKENLCEQCDRAQNADAANRGGMAAVTGTACPNCGTPSIGRFCGECGFDMASTHKSCPGCGAMCLRQARFCTDCGHGF